MNDKWARIINMKYGPDGSVYFIDWYDKQACHNFLPEIWDRANGRIYKMVYKDQPAVTVDLAKASDDELVQYQLDKNDWYVRHARRLLQERKPGAHVADKLVTLLNEQNDGPKKLRAMWALYAIDHLTDGQIIQLFNTAKDPYVRAWAIQLALDFMPSYLTNPQARPEPRAMGSTPPYVSHFAKLAKSDPSPVVRLAIASALQRLEPSDRLGVLGNLVVHGEDANDHNLPLMYWWAAEPAVGADAARGIELAKKSQIPTVRELIARRICATAVADANGDVSKVNRDPLSLLAKLLAETSDGAVQRDVLQGMSDGLKGWPSLPSPEGWTVVYDKLASSTDTQIAARTRELSVAFGEERALAQLRETVTDKNADLGDRRTAIETLVQARDPKLPPILQGLIGDPAVRSTAIRGLASYEDAKTPELILSAYDTFDTPTKVDALNALAARVDYAKALKSAVESNKIPRTDMTAATLRQLASLDNPEIQKWLTDSIGQVRTSSKDKLKEMDQWKARLSRKNWADAADPWHGRAVFAKTCMQCHTLYGVGGKVGPDLTGSNRADLNYFLTNVIDPSAVIGKDYQLWVIKTKDSRVISGIIKKDDGNALTVQTESETLIIPKADVKFQKQQPISMMPEGLLAVAPGGQKMEDVRDLFAYLGTQRQVPMLATPSNAATLFNGKDLTGWTGDESLWHVENGEIVGKTSGLKKNEFLFSTMAAANFRLAFQIKLVNNAGNSGMQFRSEALPDGEAKGYQADVGVGWWGKLYEENGRAILSDKLGEQYVKPGDWNTYEIMAVGSKITTKINGNGCADLDDPKGAARGVFGIQLHAGGATEVRVKDLKLEVDP
jgi:putative heme-binding domain-containing protein